MIHAALIDAAVRVDHALRTTATGTEREREAGEGQQAEGEPTRKARSEVSHKPYSTQPEAGGTIAESHHDGSRAGRVDAPPEGPTGRGVRCTQRKRLALVLDISVKPIL